MGSTHHINTLIRVRNPDGDRTVGVEGRTGVGLLHLSTSGWGCDDHHLILRSAQSRVCNNVIFSTMAESVLPEMLHTLL